MQHTVAKRRTWLWLTVLLLLFLLSSYLILPKQAEPYPDFSSHSPAPTGVKAFYTYLENETDSVSRWTAVPDSLPTTVGQHTLFMVEPYFIPDSEDLTAYQAFMEAGNTIFLLKSNPSGMFNIKTNFIQSESSEETTEVFGQDGQEAEAFLSSNVRILGHPDDEVLLTDDQGTIALRRTYGNGALIVVTAPQWMTNEAIMDYDHLPLLLALIPEGSSSRFFFDEYNHGSQNSSSFVALYPQWFLLLLLQGILFSLLFLWNRGKRFGPVLVAREESVRFSDESIRALAAWYIRGSRYQDSLAIQSDYVKNLLQERWGIPSNKAWMDRADILEKRWENKKQEEIRSFLIQLTSVLAKEKISKKEYLLWSKRLDELRKEVGEG